MKKLILLALMAVMITGCYERNEDGSYKAPHGDAFYGYQTIIIDSCEYARDAYQLSHKGNCRFCKERRDKEMKELVKAIKGE